MKSAFYFRTVPKAPKMVFIFTPPRHSFFTRNGVAKKIVGGVGHHLQQIKIFIGNIQIAVFFPTEKTRQTKSPYALQIS